MSKAPVQRPRAHSNIGINFDRGVQLGVLTKRDDKCFKCNERKFTYKYLGEHYPDGRFSNLPRPDGSLGYNLELKIFCLNCWNTPAVIDAIECAEEFA